MRYIFALLSLLLTVFLAYIRSSSLFSVLKANEFFFDLASELKENNHRMMLPFSAIFTDIYSKRFGEAPAINDAFEAAEFMEDKLKDAEDFDRIKELINKQGYATESDIDAILAELKNVTENALEDAKEKYKKYGKPSFILYPSVVLMLVALLA